MRTVFASFNKFLTTDYQVVAKNTRLDDLEVTGARLQGTWIWKEDPNLSIPAQPTNVRRGDVGGVPEIQIQLQSKYDECLKCVHITLREIDGNVEAKVDWAAWTDEDRKVGYDFSNDRSKPVSIATCVGGEGYGVAELNFKVRRVQKRSHGTKSVAIVGVEGSGKTVMLAGLGALYSLPDGDGYFLSPQNFSTAAYVADKIQRMRRGEWPAATAGDEMQGLDWTLRRKTTGQCPSDACGVSFLDFAGEVYRTAFGIRKNDGHAELAKEAESLRQYIRGADDLIVLINLRDVINKGVDDHRTQESMWITNEILKYAMDESNGRLRPRAAIVLSQADSYEATIKACGGPAGVLKKYLPHVWANYDWLDILTASAIGKDALDDDGNTLPDKELQFTGLKPIVEWIKQSLEESSVDESFEASDGDEFPFGGEVFINASGNGKFLCADLSLSEGGTSLGSLPIMANRGKADVWETFVFVKNDDGTVSIRSKLNNKYLSAAVDAEGQVSACADEITEREKFWLFKRIGDDRCVLQSCANKQGVSVNRDSGRVAVLADSPDECEWLTVNMA